MTMPMNNPEKTVQRQVKQAQQDAEADRVPDFSTTWAAAEARASAGRRRGWMAGSAATAAVVAAIAVITVGLLRPVEQDWQFVNPDVFENSTSWAAPSDILLPEHRVDIYREIPVLIESTKTEEGALL